MSLSWPSWDRVLARQVIVRRLLSLDETGTLQTVQVRIGFVRFQQQRLSGTLGVWRPMSAQMFTRNGDLVAAGSLAAVLEQLAAELGVDLTAVPGDWGPLVSVGIASSIPEREPVSIHIGAESRWFGVSGWSRGAESRPRRRLRVGAVADAMAASSARRPWGCGTRLVCRVYRLRPEQGRL
ncbi:hypothetical protein ABZ622_34705 [Streptomyces sp. NPDC007164]|uniref:hypothetical protein n=1 Tax=Streptomyces sp. NPDC007164 TaxID=3156918 RepID=UPI0034108CA9